MIMAVRPYPMNMLSEFQGLIWTQIESGSSTYAVVFESYPSPDSVRHGIDGRANVPKNWCFA
jgi:hypothetical protein